MTRIVTSTYRYKRPPRKRKAVPLEGPAIVSTKSSRRPVWEKAAAEAAPVPEGAVQPSTLREAERVPAPPPANDDRKPAIVTAKRRPGRFGDAPDMTPEEHRQRGDAADALFREMVRRATGEDLS